MWACCLFKTSIYFATGNYSLEEDACVRSFSFTVHWKYLVAGTSYQARTNIHYIYELQRKQKSLLCNSAEITRRPLIFSAGSVWPDQTTGESVHAFLYQNYRMENGTCMAQSFDACQGSRHQFRGHCTEDRFLSWNPYHGAKTPPTKLLSIMLIEFIFRLPTNGR